MKRILNILLTASLLLTLSVPLTGLIVHKMASALFLLLCAVHTVVYLKKLRARGLAPAAVVLIQIPADWNLSGMDSKILRFLEHNGITHMCNSAQEHIDRVPVLSFRPSHFHHLILI